MTFAHYEFTMARRSTSIAMRRKRWQVIEGELEIDVDGDVRIATPGVAAIVPPNVPHPVRALTDGKAIVVDYPLRPLD